MQGVHRYKTGFTLIEVLIAMAIFAILAVLSYTGLQSVISSKTGTEAQLDRLQALQTTILSLSTDLQHLAKRDGTDALGSSLYALSTQDSDYLVEFTRNSWRNPAASQSRGSLQRVAYKLEDDVLIRVYWRYIDRADDDAIVERDLISNIESLEFRFLDADNQWHSAWPTASMLSNASELPQPRAIELKLTMSDWGEIIRLIEVPL